MSRWPSLAISASFLPDGAPTDTGTRSNLIASLDRHLTRVQWQGAYFRALETWDGACGLTINWSDNGDIRFGGRTIADGSLGWTYGPGEGEIAGDSFLATNYTWDDPPTLLAVLLHEIGHSLGLDHSAAPDAVMNANLNIRSTLAPDDIRRIQALYGPPPQPAPSPVQPDRHEPNNSPTTAKGLGVLAMPFALKGMTLHASTDEDWYSFRVDAPGNYIVTATFEQASWAGGTFFLAVINNGLARLAGGWASSSTVHVPVKLAAGQRYFLRLLSPSGGLFRYNLAMARAG